MENGYPEIKNGNPVYLGVPLLLRRLLKKGGVIITRSTLIVFLFHKMLSKFLLIFGIKYVFDIDFLMRTQLRTVQARIIGFREHIFTGSHGAVGAAMADAEWTFGTICQRFLAGLGARMHYGHLG